MHIQYCGIQQEAIDRGIGANFDVKICIIDKLDKGLTTFNIPTQEAYNEMILRTKTKDLVLQGK
jgi:hypothetical protein